MRRRHLAPLAALAILALPLAHCGSAADPPEGSVDGGDTTVTDGGFVEEPDLPLLPADKVDVLFVVDNSRSMSDKSAALGRSVRALLGRLVEPHCVDHSDPPKDVGPPVNGVCGGGNELEHASIGDIHVGIISTSLGDQGSGEVCSAVDNRNENGRAHLLSRKPDGAPAASAEKTGVIAYSSKGAPGALTSLDQLVTDVGDVIAGAGQRGCGLEAQMEAMHRFLAQPDPEESVRVNERAGRAELVGIDNLLLAQRKAFLRPDSAVVVVMLTDEDESNVDPRSLSGQGWGFASTYFPGSDAYRSEEFYTSGSPQDSAQGTTAPRGTSACASDPASPECTSCGTRASICAADSNSAECKRLSADASCNTPAYRGTWAKPGAPGSVDLAEVTKGFHNGVDDQLNVRFFDMKRRFGVDPRYPIERYYRGLSSRTAPSRDTDHDEAGRYSHSGNCTNPLFAASLPASASDELCKLPAGARSRRLVTFHLIGGLPADLASTQERGAEWTRILGRNPDRYDTSGIDVRMIQSTTKRVDPITREVLRNDWDTAGRDLQYACTFQLPIPRDCTPQGGGGIPPEGCECGGSAHSAPVLCNGNIQVRAKAFPTPSQLQLAKALGERAVVTSICDLDEEGGYSRGLGVLAGALSPVLIR